MKGKHSPRKRVPRRFKREHVLLSFALCVFLLGLALHFSDVLDPIFAPTEPCTLAGQIMAANSDKNVGGCPAGNGTDTIRLHENVLLTEPLPAISSSIVIEGGGFKLSGPKQFRIFEVEAGTLHINGLTVTGGKAERGGAIFLHPDTTLKLYDSVIRGNWAKFGGAISSRKARIFGERIKFVSNHATYGGGAIDAADSRTELIDAEIRDNDSEDGGALRITGGQLRIHGTKFSDNTARDHGGTLHIGYSEVTIDNTGFSKNKAWRGAGIYAHDSKVTLANSSFDQNRAYVNGGAIYSHSTDASVRNCSISANSTTFDGGGIFVENGVLRLTGSTMYDNSAERNGGAVYGGFRSTILVENGSLVKNTAQAYGGGVYTEGNDVTLTHVTMVNNGAATGGGVYKKSGTLNLRNSIIASYWHGDCYGGLDENINNLIEDGSCKPLLSGEPMLAQIGDTPTRYELKRHSPAVSAGHPDFCLATDIRGYSRPDGQACDLGAYKSLIAPS